MRVKATPCVSWLSEYAGTCVGASVRRESLPTLPAEILSCPQGGSATKCGGLKKQRGHGILRGQSLDFGRSCRMVNRDIGILGDAAETGKRGFWEHELHKLHEVFVVALLPPFDRFPFPPRILIRVHRRFSCFFVVKSFRRFSLFSRIP